MGNPCLMPSVSSLSRRQGQKLVSLELYAGALLCQQRGGNPMPPFILHTVYKSAACQRNDVYCECSWRRLIGSSTSLPGVRQPAVSTPLTLALMIASCLVAVCSIDVELIP